MRRTDSRVTLAEVAAAAGVSVMTASYTYNRPERVSAASRSKVFAAADAVGYGGPDPRARSLRSGSAGTLGVLLGERLSYAFRDPQAAAFLGGAADVCADRGVGMTILPISGGESDARRIREAEVDGFVVWTTADDDPILAAVAATRRPTAVHSGPAMDGATVIGINNRSAARRVAGLAFAGARRPAVLSFPVDRDRRASLGSGEALGPVTFAVTRDRLAGFRLAARDNGLAWSDVCVAVCERNDRDVATDAARHMFALRPRPDAIAAMSDEQAAGVVRAATEAGLRVPRDVVVTGWDDGAVAAELGITTVAQSMRDQGAAAALAVLDPTARVPRPRWRVVERASTRPAAD